MYRNIFTFLSLPCVAVLAVPLYHVASVYARCVHAKYETPQNLQCFLYNFKDNQFCWVCCLERILWRL